MLSAPLLAVSLTLLQAITRAESAGFQVRMASADAQSAAAQAAASRAALFPQASVSGTTSNGGITQLGMPYAQQNYFSANLTVPLFTPNTFETAQSAGRAARAAVFTQAEATNDAMLSAVQEYEGALLAEAIYDARQTTLTYEQRHLRDVTIAVNSGALPRYVLAESRAALAQAQQNAEDAAAQRDEAMNDLKVALAFDLASPITLSDALKLLRVTDNEDLFLKRAAASRPDVLAAQQQVQAAQARVAAARSAYVPAISATAQTYNGGSSPPLGNHGYQVGVTASLPVLDGGSRTAELHLAQADLSRAQAALEQATLSAQRDVMNAWRELQAAQRNLQTAHAQETAAVDMMRVTALRERRGKGITLETLDALSREAAARESLLRAIARVNIAVASVHRAAGDSTIS